MKRKFFGRISLQKLRWFAFKGLDYDILRLINNLFSCWLNWLRYYWLSCRRFCWISINSWRRIQQCFFRTISAILLILNIWICLFWIFISKFYFLIATVSTTSTMNTISLIMNNCVINIMDKIFLLLDQNINFNSVGSSQHDRVRLLSDPAILSILVTFQIEIPSVRGFWQ